MYTWTGIKQLTKEEALVILKTEGLLGFYILYPDNTEALIEEEYSREAIIEMYEKGLTIGYEY